MEKSVCLAHDSGWESLGNRVQGSRKDYSTKDSVGI